MLDVNKATDPPSLEQVAESIANKLPLAFCWNVRYTAALYVTLNGNLNVDETWTYENQEKSKIPLRQWLLLKKRHHMMLKAFETLAAPSYIRDIYCAHYKQVRNLF